MKSTVRSSKKPYKNSAQTKLDEFARMVSKAMDIAVKRAIGQSHAKGMGAPVWHEGAPAFLMPDGSIQPVRKRRRGSRAA